MEPMVGYIYHDSVGNEIQLFISDNYFYVYDGDNMFVPVTKKELQKCDLPEEYNEAILAHLLRFNLWHGN